MDVSSAPAAGTQFSLQTQDAEKFDFETCYSSGESSILMSHVPSKASAVASGCALLPISGVCEKKCVLRVNAPTAFAPLDGGDWPERPAASQQSPILLSRRVTVCSGGVDHASSGGSPIVMRASAGGADGSCLVCVSGPSGSSDREESFAVMKARVFTLPLFRGQDQEHACRK